MIKGRVVVTDYGFSNLDQEREMLGKLGYQLIGAQCRTELEVMEQAREADALLVQWAPVSGNVIRELKQCKVIVRYGIGVNNVDLEAAGDKNIPVCNVPDYCLNEVADHALALALALGRQLTETDKRVREGVWEITPAYCMPAFRETWFVTLGYGRIAREVLKRAAAFGFKVAACDPNVSGQEMEKDHVASWDLSQVFTGADILSLHLPLTEKTEHIIDVEGLQRMKPTSILINTSRGGLINTLALAEALQKNQIGAAGLDVFEREPLQADHPLRICERVLLTSHTAWYSELSVSTLQRMAAEEVVRGLTGKQLRNRVN